MTLISRELLAVLLAKVAITIIAIFISGWIVGANGALAAAVGGLISIANVLYYTFRVLRTTTQDTDTVYIRGLMRTQLSKYAFSTVFLFIALGLFKLAVVPLIGTFVVTQIAYFFVLATRD